jgi:hypothetical protein
MFTGIGLLAFCFIFGAAMIGLAVGGKLPENYRTEPTQKTVQSVMTVIGLLSALVLGLLIASTKANYDTRSAEVEQFAANVTLLDREMMHFGREAKDWRDLLRGFTARKIALTWPKGGASGPVMHDAQTVQMLDDVQERLRAWTPNTEAEREGRTNALRLTVELQRTSRLLAVQQSSQAPTPFLVVVIFWVGMLFLSYAIFAPRNATVVAAIVVAAISVSVAVNLIFDMDRPFSGFIRVAPTAMQQALDQMNP